LALHGLLLLLLTNPAADIIPLVPTGTSALLLLGQPKLGLLLLLPLLLLFKSDGLLLLLCMGLFGRLFVALLLLSLIPKALQMKDWRIMEG